MGVGTVEIKVRTTDAGESQVIKRMNADLAQTDKAQKTAAASASGMGQGLVNGVKGVTQAKEKFAQLTGVIPGVAAGIAAIGVSISLISELFGGFTTTAEDSLKTLAEFGKVLDANSAKAKTLAADVQAVFDRARDARIMLLRMAGEGAEADALTRQKNLDAYVTDVTSAQRKLQEVNSQILGINGAKQAAEVARRTFDEIVAEQEVRMRRMLFREGSTARIPASFRAEGLGADERERKAKAEAAAVQAELTLGALVKSRATLEQTIADIKQGPQLEAAGKLEASLMAGLAAQKDALKAQASAAASYAGLLKDQGASRAEVRKAQVAEFEIRKQIALVEVRASLSALETEDKKLASLTAQYLLMGQIDKAAATYNARADIASARGTIGTYEAALAASAFKAGGGGGKATPAAKTEAARGFVYSGAANDDAFAAGMLVVGGDKGAEAEARYTAAIADAEERRTDAVARRFDLLRRQAAAPAKDRDQFDAALNAAGADIQGAQRDVLTAERDRQKALTEIEMEGEDERRRLREDALQEQLDGIARVLGSATDALSQMESLGSGGTFFDAAARAASSLAENWDDLVKGKAGAIQAIGEETTAGIKNIKTRAALMVLVSVAEGASQAIAQNWPGVIAAGVAAIAWGAVAGSGGGSGAQGRTPTRTPSVRAGGVGMAGGIVINLNAPWIGSNPQEVGKYINTTTAAAAGTGF